MIKLVAIVVVVVGFVLVGFGVASWYKRRNRFFDDLLYFCDLLTGEISFLQRKLLQIVNLHKDSFAVDFFTVISCYERYVRAQSKKEELKKELLAISFLSEEEVCSIYDFLLSLGNFDVENEVLNIKNYKNCFVRYCTKANKEAQKYAPLCIKVGFIIGCTIAIVLL